MSETFYTPTSPTTPEADVLVLTVTEGEGDALRHVFPGDEKSFPWYFHLDRPGRGTLRVAFDVIGSQGGPKAAETTTRLLKDLRPRLAILLGTCAGNPDHLSIDDVVISEAIWDYVPGSLRPRGKYGRPNIFLPPAGVLKQVRRLTRGSPSDLNLDWWRSMRESGPSCRDCENRVSSQQPTLEILPIAAGEWKWDDSRVWEELERFHEKLGAVEMEAHGFATSCHAHGIPWLVVRGVSDHAGKVFKPATSSGIPGIQPASSESGPPDNLETRRHNRYSATRSATLLVKVLLPRLDLSPEGLFGELHPSAGTALSHTELPRAPPVSPEEERPHDPLLRLLEEKGCYVRGHFVLTNGWHSEWFAHVRVGLMDEVLLTAFARKLARELRSFQLDGLATSTIGGTLLAEGIRAELVRQGRPRVTIIHGQMDGINDGRQEPNFTRSQERRNLRSSELCRIAYVVDYLTANDAAARAVDSLEEVGLGSATRCVAVALDRRSQVERENSPGGVTVGSRSLKIIPAANEILDAWDPNSPSRPCILCRSNRFPLENLRNQEKDFFNVVVSFLRARQASDDQTCGIGDQAEGTIADIIMAAYDRAAELQGDLEFQRHVKDWRHAVPLIVAGRRLPSLRLEQECGLAIFLDKVLRMRNPHQQQLRVYSEIVEHLMAVAASGKGLPDRNPWISFVIADKKVLAKCDWAWSLVQLGNGESTFNGPHPDPKSNDVSDSRTVGNGFLLRRGASYDGHEDKSLIWRVHRDGRFPELLESQSFDAKSVDLSQMDLITLGQREVPVITSHGSNEKVEMALDSGTRMWFLRKAG